MLCKLKYFHRFFYRSHAALSLLKRHFMIIYRHVIDHLIDQEICCLIKLINPQTTTREIADEAGTSQRKVVRML